MNYVGKHRGIVDAHLSQSAFFAISLKIYKWEVECARTNTKHTSPDWASSTSIPSICIWNFCKEYFGLTFCRVMGFGEAMVDKAETKIPSFEGCGIAQLFFRASELKGFFKCLKRGQFGHTGKNENYHWHVRVAMREFQWGRLCCYMRECYPSSKFGNPTVAHLACAN